MMAERLAATLAAASFLAAACPSFFGAVADKDRPKIFLQGKNARASEQMVVSANQHTPWHKKNCSNIPERPRGTAVPLGLPSLCPNIPLRIVCRHSKSHPCQLTTESCAISYRGGLLGGAYLKTRLCVMSSLFTRWYAGRSSSAAYHCAMCGKLG